MANYKLVEYDVDKNRKYLCTIRKTELKILGITIRKKKLFQVYGSGTVWHYFPRFERCETCMEEIFYDFYSLIKYKEAHE